jgi:hypothetical protein
MTNCHIQVRQIAGPQMTNEKCPMPSVKWRIPNSPLSVPCVRVSGENGPTRNKGKQSLTKAFIFMQKTKVWNLNITTKGTYET